MANTYQTTLYNDLMNLVDSSESFYFKDFEFGGRTYRIFNYRLTSYTEFLKPNALECRGHMFEMFNGGMVRLASLPMEKFFNLHENPLTMDVDLSTVDQIEVKADGSLISSFVHFNVSDSLLRLKTKGSLNSDQCIDAMNWLSQSSNDQLADEIRQLTLAGYTINLEWCSPTNRIVLGYEKPHLTVLCVRDNRTGEYIDKTTVLIRNNKAMHDAWIEQIEVNDSVKFVSTIPEMEHIEGYVVRIGSGQRIKIKTTWYLTLHHTKDSVNSPRRLFEAVLEEATDDMRSLFHDDPVAIQMIEEMEQKVDKLYNHYVDIVERFYERNKNLERKDYAILGQKELPRMVFSLAMSKYLGKSFSYKDWMKKHWKDFGIKDNTDE